MVDRLRTDFDKMMGIFESLTPEDWTGLMVPHFYMGPVPAFFYPAFQLMDYGIHSWDIREGTGREHGLHSDVADLLVPFMFGIWAGTMREAQNVEPFQIGVRITTGPNAGDSRVSVSGDGMAYEQGDVSDLPAVIEFDPGSFVLTAFGRFNGGTVRGDKDLADRFLGMFFRIPPWTRHRRFSVRAVAHEVGMSAPPSCESRCPKRTYVGCGTNLPATKLSPCRKVVAR